MLHGCGVADPGAFGETARMSPTRPHLVMALVAILLLPLSFVGLVRLIPEIGAGKGGIFLLCVFILAVSAFVIIAVGIRWPVVFLSGIEFRHWKAVRIAILALLLITFLAFVPALARSERRAVVVNTKGALLSSYVDLQAKGVLTNTWSVRHHVRPYTNRYVLDGTVYQCVLAADSWDYQGASNLLALTADKTFLYIDQRRAIPLQHMPPGY